MKQSDIRQQWEAFVQTYPQFFTKSDDPILPTPLTTTTTISSKSTTLKDCSSSSSFDPTTTASSSNKRRKSAYEEISCKLAHQHSTNSNQMFVSDPSLWHAYHDRRDQSFLGYDVHADIPVNQIIAYLETKKMHTLNILDLGCGRNKIAQHFSSHSSSSPHNVHVTGYDHVAHNGSIACDIATLPDADESVNMCIYSQSLMGSNWQQYLQEGYRVLVYHGEMIIAESIDRYETILAFVNQQLHMHILSSPPEMNRRWFVLQAIKR